MDDIILTAVTLIVLFGSLFGGIGVLSHFLQHGFVLPDTLGTVLCFYIVAVLLAVKMTDTDFRDLKWLWPVNMVLAVSVLVPYLFYDFSFPLFKVVVAVALVTLARGKITGFSYVFLAYIGLLRYSGIPVSGFPVWVQAGFIFFVITIMLCGMLAVMAVIKNRKEGR